MGKTDTVREMEAVDWALLSDQELLERRISKLGLRLEGTALEPLIRQLYDELSAKGLVFHPPCHIGDEWFVPIGIPAIFVPSISSGRRRRKDEVRIRLRLAPARQGKKKEGERVDSESFRERVVES